jgi:hypothetical protein
VNTNAVTRAGFRRDMIKNEFKSALLYKLQKKKCLESNNRSNKDSIFTGDTSTSLQLLVMWEADDRYSFSVCALLIKHSNAIIWDKDTLEKLHSMNLALLKNDHNIKNMWLLDNETVLMTTSKQEVGHTIKITVSKENKEDDSMEPLWVSSSM